MALVVIYNPMNMGVATRLFLVTKTYFIII